VKFEESFQLQGGRALEDFEGKDEPTLESLVLYEIEGKGVTYAEYKKIIYGKNAMQLKDWKARADVRKVNRQFFIHFATFDPPPPNQTDGALVHLAASNFLKVIMSESLPRGPVLKEFPGDLLDTISTRTGVDVKSGSVLNKWLDWGDLNYIPTFRNTYLIGLPDFDLANLVNEFAMRQTDPVLMEANKSGMVVAKHVAATMKLFNGSPEGQIKRMAACNKVRAVVSNAVPIVDLRRLTNSTTYNPVLTAFKTLIPAKPSKLLYDDVFLELLTVGNLSEMLDYAAENQVRLVKFNLKADAGPSFPHLKLQDVLVQNVYEAQKMLDRIKDVDAKVVRAEYEFCRYTPMKAKAEVYNIEDYSEKTRNIYPYNNFSMIWATIMLKLGFSEYIPATAEGGSMSLLGFSPFGGGLSRFLEIIRRGPGIYVFADNAYIVFMHDGKLHYASLDASKMEASIFTEDTLLTARDCIGRITTALKEHGTDAANTFLGSNTWVAMKIYLLNFWPVFACQGIAVLGSLHFDLEQLGSGAQGTGLINTGKMTRFAIRWGELGEVALLPVEGGSWEFNKAGKEAMKQVGLVMKIEHCEELKMQDEPMTLDLLGFDMWCDPEHNIPPLPVLNIERLWKAALFWKTKKSSTKKGTDPYYEALLTLSKFRCLSLVGAYTEPALSSAMRAISHRTLTEIGVMGDYSGSTMDQDVQFSVEKAVDSMLGEYVDDNVKSALAGFSKSSAVPTMYEIINICYSAEYADGWLASLIEGTSGVLTNLEVILPLADVDTWSRFVTANPDAFRGRISGPVVNWLGQAYERAEAKREELRAKRVRKPKVQSSSWADEVEEVGNNLLSNIQLLEDIEGGARPMGISMELAKPSIRNIQELHTVKQEPRKRAFGPGVLQAIMNSIRPVIQSIHGVKEGWNVFKETLSHALSSRHSAPQAPITEAIEDLRSEMLSEGELVGLDEAMMMVLNHLRSGK
jgi:hypothetical protein